MVTELGLKGSELIIYAVIFGFSQDGSTMYTGSAQYLADWTNTTKQSVFKVLKSLTDRKLIIRHEETRNGVMFVSYSYNPDALVTGDKQSLLGWSTKFTGVVNKVDGGSKQSLPNNIEDKLEYNKDYKLEETRVSKDTLPKEKSGKSAKTGPFVVNNLYVESQTRENGIPSVNQLVYPDKDSIGKDSIDKSSIMSGNEAENGNSDVKTIIEYLNLKAKKNFRETTKLYERHINARLSEGYTLEDFKHVIDVKCAEWMNTDHEQYLRPDTLFAPSHFDSYLNQKIVKAKPKSAIYFSNDECREQMKNETPTF